MRLISTLCLLLFSFCSFSQIEDLIRKSEYENITVKIIPYICGFGRSFMSSSVDLASLQGKMIRPKDSVLFKDLQIKTASVYISEKSNRDTVKKQETKIVIRCGNRYLNETPLIIIDGVPQDSQCLRTLNSNDIERIDILKGPAASAIYGYKSSNGVIIVTTKNAKLRKFIIKDFLDGSAIPGATVSFISADKKNTIMMASNDSGIVVTDKLKSSVKYNISISAIGYKKLTQTYKNEFSNREKELILEREVKSCEEAVVVVYGYLRRVCYSCCMVGTKITYNGPKTESDNKISVGKIFPNPVQKGKIITIESTTQSEGPVQIKITGLDGKLLLSQPQKAIKGLNRFTVNTDPRWSAGIYFIQLYANGKLLASDKVMIQ